MAGAGPWEDYAAAATAPETEGPWSAYGAAPQPGAPQVSTDLLSSIRAGLQASASGLALRGKAPDVVTGAQTPWYDRAAASVAQTGADIPEMAVGAALGSEIPGVGNVAGAFAVPMAMRKALMQAYQQHGVHSWEDLWGVSKQAILGLGEGALEGKLLGGATKLANIGVDAMSPLVASSAARALGPIIRGVAVSGAQSATLATAGAALEGRMPTAQDFLDSAVVIGGLHAATGIAGTLRDIYGATGRTPTQVTVDASNDPNVNFELTKPVEPPVTDEPMVTAYHGSPYEFEQFDLSKIGTGEGAQARGHGIYAAEAKGVGDSYAVTTVRAKAVRDFLRELPEDADREEVEAASQSLPPVLGNLVRALQKEDWLGFDYPSQAVNEALKGSAELAKNFDVSPELRKAVDEFTSSGNTYRLQIPQRVVDGMLDLDKPLSEQPYAAAAIRAVAARVGAPAMPDIITGREAYDRLTASFAHARGEGALQAIKSFSGDQAEASSALLNAGVRGNKYLDRASRAAGEGTRNFVIFDPKDARIISRNGNPIPPAYAEAAKAETARAAVPDPQPGVEPLKDPHIDALEIPAEGKPPSAVDTSNINSLEDLDLATGRLTALYGEETQKQGRWVVPRAESMAKGAQLLSDALGATPEGGNPLPHAIEDAENAHQLWARVSLVQDTAARTKILADQIAKADPASLTPQQLSDFLAQVERTGMIGSHFMGARAEAGRALNILRSTRGLADQYQAMQDAIKQYGDTKDVQQLAKAFADSDSTASTIAAARKSARVMGTGEKIMRGIVQIRNAMLLSGLKTYQAKAVGDAVITVSEAASRWLGAGIGMLHPGESISPTEALAYTTGLARAIPDALKTGVDAWKNPDAYTPFEKQDVITNKVLGEVLGGIQHRIMGSETEAFRTLNARAELSGQAVRMALKAKLAPGTDAFNDFVSNVIANPPDELAEASRLAGDRATYTEKLGKIGRAIQSLSQVPLLNLTLIPFARVPANLFKTAVRYTPGAALILDDVQKDFAAGGAQRDIAIARQLIGAGVMYSVYHAVQNGNMTGGFLAMTPGERAAAIADGRQPYSFKVGDKWLSFSRMEYASHIAGLAADLAEVSQRVNGDDKVSIPILAAAALGHSMISSTYMAGLNETLQAINDPARAVKRWAYQFAGSFEPALTAQIATANDPYRRRIDSLMDELKSRLPGFRQELLPQINEGTGEPMPNNKNLTIMDESTEVNDPVLKEAERLGVNLGKAPKAIHVGRGTGKAGAIQITPEQQNAYSAAAGEFSHMILSSFVNTPAWQSMPEPVKARIFERTLEEAHKQAAFTALPPEARMAAMTQIMQQVTQEYRKR